MKRLNYSNITAVLRRIHQAALRSEKNGIPVAELLDQDRELRLKLQAQRLENQQRRDFIKTLGGIGLGASLMPMGNIAFAAAGPVNGQGDTRVAIVGRPENGASSDAIRLDLENLRSQHAHRWPYVFRQRFL